VQPYLLRPAVVYCRPFVTVVAFRTVESTTDSANPSIGLRESLKSLTRAPIGKQSGRSDAREASLCRRSAQPSWCLVNGTQLPVCRLASCDITRQARTPLRAPIDLSV